MFKTQSAFDRFFRKKKGPDFFFLIKQLCSVFGLSLKQAPPTCWCDTLTAPTVNAGDSRPCGDPSTYNVNIAGPFLNQLNSWRLIRKEWWTSVLHADLQHLFDTQSTRLYSNWQSYHAIERNIKTVRQFKYSHPQTTLWEIAPLSRPHPSP